MHTLIRGNGGVSVLEHIRDHIFRCAARGAAEEVEKSQAEHGADEPRDDGFGEEIAGTDAVRLVVRSHRYLDGDAAATSITFITGMYVVFDCTTDRISGGCFKGRSVLQLQRGLCI